MRRHLNARWLVAVLVAVAIPALAVDEPEYAVQARIGEVEVRRYQPFVIAELPVEGEFDEVGNRAFRTLVKYISGANQAAEDIAMTAPVRQTTSSADSLSETGVKIDMTAPVMQSSADGQQHRVSFVLPDSYSLETAPVPTDSRIRLREVPARTVAALPYSGTWSEANYREHETELLQALEQAGYTVVGLPEWARYNAPFVPWFMRRNEVLVEVRGAPE